MSSEFDIRLRLYTDPATRGRVLPTQGDVMFTATASPALSFSATSLVAGELTQPFYVGVELRGATGWYKPDFDLFTVSEDDAEDVDRAGVMSFTGVNYVLDSLATAVLEDGTIDGAITFAAASAGGVMSYLIAQHPEIGVTVGFNASVDSNGTAWPAEDVADQTFQQLTNVGAILSTLCSGNFCSWASRGTELILTAVSTGDTLTEPEFGPGASSVKTKTSTTDSATDFLVVSDTGIPVQHVSRPSLGLGTRQAVITVSGAADAETALRMATPLIDAAAAVRREVTVMYDGPRLPARPFEDFRIGDVVPVRSRGTTQSRELVGVQVSGGTPATVRLTFGEMFLTKDAKLARRAAQLAIGTATATGGSGKPIVAPAIGQPATPVGFAVTSNVGAFDSAGAPFAVTVLEWDPVTVTTDGAATLVTEYELWVRTEGSSPEPAGRTALATQTFVLAGETRYYTVRAFNGAWSAMSDEIAVTPATPTMILPTPGEPDLASALGSVAVRTTLPTETFFRDMLVERRDGSDWVVIGSFNLGSITDTGLEVGSTQEYRLVARDTLGRLTAAGPSASITVLGVGFGDVVAGSITEVELGDDAVTAPKIAMNEGFADKFWGNEGNFGRINVDHLSPAVGDTINLTGNGFVVDISDRAQDALDAADGAAADLAEMRTRYDFGPSEAVISSPGSNFSFHLDAAGAAIYEGPSKASWWVAGQFFVSSLVGDEVVLANHKFEKYGDDTVMRAI